MVFMVLIDNQNIQNRSYKAATFFKKYLEHPAPTHPAVLSGVNPINVTHVGQAVGINFVGKSVASSSHFFVVQPTAKLEIFVNTSQLQNTNNKNISLFFKSLNQSFI